MRVLHLVKTSSGAPWALRQMRELVALGVEVHVAIPADGPLVPAYEDARVHVHLVDAGLPVREPWKWGTRAAAVRTLVAAVCPDIIHSHFVATTLTARLALGRHADTPRIFQVPGPLHLEHPLFRRGELATAGSADYWMASCEWTKQCYISQGIHADRVFLSYYGADTEYMQPRPGVLRRELELDRSVPLIGTIAYFYAPKRYLLQRRGLKGHEDLIDATAILAQDNPQIQCVIIGGPAPGAERYYQAVQAYARRRAPRRVKFLGFRPDVRSVYADLDVAVHPSHSDNVGGALESMLLGIPTVATRVGGFVDVVRPGVTGWLAPPKNPHALAEQIACALKDSDTARTYARAGRELVTRLLDVRQNARQVLAAYETILRTSNQNGALQSEGYWPPPAS